MYPLFLKLENVKCLVIGGGAVAERKIISLTDSGAEITIISPTVTDNLGKLIKQNSLIYYERLFQKGDTSGFFLIIAATDSIEANKRIYDESIKNGTLINCVDDPEHCNFYVPAQIRRDDIQIAVSSSGKLPMFAGKLREIIENMLPMDIGKELDRLSKIRTEIITSLKDDPDLKKLKLKTVLEPKIEKLLKAAGLK
ncbi:MAG: bifunctional precorrin-2 dehydrogenase/sirohydrochlorin ferrochelatase [Spirochaetales bacterium]|nr:bifunctional precorrin-2 dehydrogenase/sirohydrochlorin ferrochelatase [Spirochaetales bacterium]